MALALVLVYLFFALIPAAIAQRKGRSQLGFFLLAIFFTPLLSLILVLIISPGRATVPVYQAWRCGFCLTPLDPTWREKCKRCGSTFAQYPPTPPPTAVTPA